MDNEEFSIIIWCRHDLQTNTTQLRGVRVDTNEEVRFSDSCFLLRTSIDMNGTVLRCYIRHMASGSEAYLQSAPKLIAFIQSYLLEGGEPGNTMPNTAEE